MARIRSVHPRLFTDEGWVSCSPLARLLYIGLWTDADDQGIFEWRPLTLKMKLLPGDGAKVSDLLDELLAVNLIAQFSHKGAQFGAIKEFRRWQKPKKPNSVHFLPPELRDYVWLSAEDGEVENNEDGEVLPEGGTGGEKSEQREDGGGRGGEKGKDAHASSVSLDARLNDFQRFWELYPHFEGRGSYPLALKLFNLLPEDIAKLLPAAAERFAKSKSIPLNGAAAAERWIGEEKYRHWLAATAPIGPRPVFQNTPLRDRLIDKCGEPWVIKWLDHCQWRDIPEPQIVAQFDFTANNIRDGLRKLMPPADCRVVVEKVA